MGELSRLPNIGKTLEEQLQAIGIDTVDQLRWRARFKGFAGTICRRRAKRS